MRWWWWWVQVDNDIGKRVQNSMKGSLWDILDANNIPLNLSFFYTLGGHW